jgi:hypothetical protein
MAASILKEQFDQKHIFLGLTDKIQVIKNDAPRPKTFMDV